MKPDLTSLYSQLGLKPDCSLAEFQLAYRRRISELQPDHQDPRQQSPESSTMLRDLVWMYSTAGRFHRRYGRLPGAAPAPQRAAAVESSNAHVQRTYAAYRQVPPSNRQLPPAQVLRGLSFLLVILLFGLLAWWDWWDWLNW